jgi:hypothetical protein
VISYVLRLSSPNAHKDFNMHDLQTIIKLNAPLNQRTDAATQKAYAIERGVAIPVPVLDHVEYGTAPEQLTLSL